MSTDGRMTAEEAIKTAQENGLGIIFTEHYDADSPDNDYDFRVDVGKYMAEYERYRSDDVLMGIEVGLTHLCAEKNAAIIKKGTFDFVLGSVHMIGDVDIYIDLMVAKRPTITKKTYLDYVLRMVTECGYYDALGHIDYPSRYFSGGNGYADDYGVEIDYDEYKKIYDEIFDVLSKKEKPLEINTRRLNKKSAHKCAYGVLKGYRERGGLYVTIGSDAHNTGSIGVNFNTAEAMVRELSLVPVYFKNRAMVVL